MLNRRRFIENLDAEKVWDLIVVGGGATGLGIAVDSASRGFSTLLLEQADFAKGTSSRSTKLVHGGVRYLAKGDVGLVFAALRERGLLLQNAGHLVRRQAFIIPSYSFFSQMKYLVGLKLYDWMSGRFSFGKSSFLNKEETMRKLPGINPEGLNGSIEYFDGQFDDARLAINLAQTAASLGAVLLNYFCVKGLLKQEGRVAGVKARDEVSGNEFELRAKTVINATGVFVDDLLQMDEPGRAALVRPSQGVHLVVDKSFLPGGSALMIPETPDGRVLFAVPWHDHVLLGTTDTPLDRPSLEPVALDKEVQFILETVKQYLVKPPAEADVLSVFAGLRPLAAPEKNTNSTKEISRDHKLIVSASGLVTITGGKWTTYRKMAEETVDRAILTGSLENIRSKTKQVAIHGSGGIVSPDHLAVYGSDADGIRQLVAAQPETGRKLVEAFPNIEAEVLWIVRNEMPVTIEDLLARRLRLLFLDATAAVEAAPRVARIMAAEMGMDARWETTQVREFTKLAGQYMLTSSLPGAEMPGSFHKSTKAAGH